MIKGIALFDSISFQGIVVVMIQGTEVNLLLSGEDFGGTAGIGNPHMM